MAPTCATIRPMPQAEPVPLAEVVHRKINDHILSCGHLRGLGTFEKASVERDIALIERSDAATAHLYRGTLAVTFGDLDGALYHFANARKLGASHTESAEVNTLSNLGFASRALTHARLVMLPGTADISAMFPAALAAGAATTVERVITESQATGQVLAEFANEYIPIARNLSTALVASGHTEDQLAAVLDVAGEVLRENRLLWLDAMPTVIAQAFATEDSAPGVHYFFRVDVSGGEGARLTGEIGWRLVDRDLVFPALTVALVGSRREGIAA
jgi:hypothetical protein